MERKGRKRSLSYKFFRDSVYYCSLKDLTIEEMDTVHCIVKGCYYLLLLKPEELEYIRSIYNINHRTL